MICFSARLTSETGLDEVAYNALQRKAAQFKLANRSVARHRFAPLVRG